MHQMCKIKVCHTIAVYHRNGYITISFTEKTNTLPCMPALSSRESTAKVCTQTLVGTCSSNVLVCWRKKGGWGVTALPHSVKLRLARSTLLPSEQTWYFRYQPQTQTISPNVYQEQREERERGERKKRNKTHHRRDGGRQRKK